VIYNFTSTIGLWPHDTQEAITLYGQYIFKMYNCNATFNNSAFL